MKAKFNIMLLTGMVTGLFSVSIIASSYGTSLCSQSRYQCHDINSGASWADMFPDPKNREIVKRINRTNLPLSRHDQIAVPANLERTKYLSHAPFSMSRDTNGRRAVVVDISDMAFGAYSKQGELIHWGPLSAGRRCNNNIGACRTPLGSYDVNTQKSVHHESSVYPLETNGGAPMPYAMHYLRGFALHGSPTVPGHHASHGCIRLFKEDAKWLNQQFTDIGTPIIVRR